MHSSRMRTARTATIWGECTCRGGVPGPGGCSWSRGGVPVPGGVPGPWGTWSRGGVPGPGGAAGPGGCTWSWGGSWSWGVYLVPGGVPGPGGCTWSLGGPGPGGVYLVLGVYLVPGGGSWSATPPPLWTEWQTGVKILPCPKLRLRAVKTTQPCWPLQREQLFRTTQITGQWSLLFLTTCSGKPHLLLLENYFYFFLRPPKICD